MFNLAVFPGLFENTSRYFSTSWCNLCVWSLLRSVSGRSISFSWLFTRFSSSVFVAVVWFIAFNWFMFSRHIFASFWPIGIVMVAFDRFATWISMLSFGDIMPFAICSLVSRFLFLCLYACSSYSSSSIGVVDAKGTDGITWILYAWYGGIVATSMAHRTYVSLFVFFVSVIGSGGYVCGGVDRL